MITTLMNIAKTLHPIDRMVFLKITNKLAFAGVDLTDEIINTAKRLTLSNNKRLWGTIPENADVFIKAGIATPIGRVVQLNDEYLVSETEYYQNL